MSNEYAEFILKGVVPTATVDYFKPNDYYSEIEWHGMYFIKQHFALVYHEIKENKMLITEALFMAAVKIWLKDNDIDWLDSEQTQQVYEEAYGFCSYPSEVFEFLDGNIRIEHQVINKEE